MSETVCFDYRCALPCSFVVANSTSEMSFTSTSHKLKILVRSKSRNQKLITL